MKITIITVCYNAADHIEETILSVIGQTYEDIEYIIVDGRSTDTTMDIVRKYEGSISKIISEPDKGIYDAMNKGIALATGDYINFMNAGDTFSSPDAVKDVAMQMDGKADVVYGNSTMIDYSGSRVFDPGATDISMIRKKPIYRHNASFTRTSLHKRFPFDLTKKAQFKHALDYNHIFNIWHNGASFRKVDVDVVTWKKIGTSDRDMLNIRLMYSISHQFRQPTMKEWLVFIFDYIKAFRRDMIRKLNGH